jgi:hypothetical protein
MDNVKLALLPATLFAVLGQLLEEKLPAEAAMLVNV